MKLVLASGSPRRRVLLEGAGIPIRAVRPAEIDEEWRPDERPLPYARRLARQKAAACPIADLEAPVVTLAADTVVHLDGQVFGKPLDAADATRMLLSLSDRWHQVSTAWCIRLEGRSLQGLCTSRVRFRALGQAEIQRYIASGEPMDKAGAYGIQGLGVALVERVVGSYTNVIGLPLRPVLRDLARAGITQEDR